MDGHQTTGLLVPAFEDARTEMDMQLILTSDLHQSIQKWPDLVSAVKEQQPHFVLIAGDILPKVEPIRRQEEFFPQMGRYLRAMKDAGPVTILTYLGNDDAHIFEPHLDELEAAGLCVNLNGRVHREDSLVFCGMNKVRDYPFGYKHWCARDGNSIACPQQLCGEGLELNESCEFVPIDNLVEYLSAKPSLGEELDRLKAKIRPGEMARSIWMIHQPPCGLGMDICTGNEQVGSPAVLEFIKVHQPLLGCSGHIHESPYQPGGRWNTRVGGTVWVQPGQAGDRLHYASVEIGNNLEVAQIRHSLFCS
jgi:Icc-related predicted phosphoesterase